MRALSIRQPYAELILRGIKTVEYRSRSTRIIGERFHIYASLKRAAVGSDIWSRDLAMPGDALPRWMIELAEQVGMIEAGALLPTGTERRGPKPFLIHCSRRDYSCIRPAGSG